MDKKFLRNVADTLKTEFDGIDNIIESVIKPLYGWEDSNSRPVIVTLLGLTGTGKSSLINRLVQLLGYEEGLVRITCNDSSDDDNVDDKLENKIAEQLGIFKWNCSKSIKEVDSRRVFIFDEIQKVRTKDEDGNEISKSSMNGIWRLIDEGKLDWGLNHDAGTSSGELSTYVRALTKLFNEEESSKVIVEDCCTTDEKTVKVLRTLGYLDFFTSNPLSKNTEDRIPTWANSKSEPEKKPEGPETFNLIPLTLRDGIREILCTICTIEESKILMESMLKKQSLAEFISTLQSIEKMASKVYDLDFHNSLIFIIGNLDEAFELADGFNPDIDADVYHYYTSRVNSTDIKEALKSRFRNEQISRLGNNFVIYPSFTKDTFKKIIKRTLNAECEEFYKVHNIKVDYDPVIINLLYSEGVFPTQGARPVLSTVRYFCYIFSEILDTISGLTDKPTKLTLTLSDADKYTSFNKPQVNVIVKTYVNDTYDGDINIPYELELGKLRDPHLNEDRYITSVHEIGHAIMMTLTTGKYPSKVASTTSSVDAAGFCMKNMKALIESNERISTKKSIENSIKVLLSGWAAEKVIFGDENYSLGASNDIQKAWGSLSRSVYKCGYLDSLSYGRTCTTDGIPLGYKDSEVLDNLKNIYKRLEKETLDTMTKYQNVIRCLSKDLAGLGSIDDIQFERLLNKHADIVPEVKDFFYPENTTYISVDEQLEKLKIVPIKDSRCTNIFKKVINWFKCKFNN